MQTNIEINLLANCTHHIPTLAQLWLDEIGKPWIPNANIDRAIQTYQSHINHDKFPLTFVATDNDQAIAMASLRVDDGLGEHITPWFGSLIVHPNYRRQGIGEKLISVCKEQAKKMGHEKLYLLALDPTIPKWYERLQWKTIGNDKLYHHPVTVMETEL